eukprot:TRINITY_DN174_c0_g4_i1.p1 TRINITY_DN174_c0_g4~~TRINITY_DN174_c0_g4_i1.p1  ORF type:complete len:379 (-),score=123.37 TRINITY_DN174_c0_g4_i1:53-1147(-)
MSCKLLNFLIDQNSLDYDTPDVSFVESLIRGSTPTASDRSWMYDIVHNSRNGVDVDKFDYLARDAFMLGIKNSCDFARLMAYSKVIGGAVCYHVKEAYGVYEMFHARYTLFRRVYSHRVAKAIDYMVADALTLADPYLHISDCLNDPERFSALTDGILRNIEFSTAPELGEAKKIVCDIRKRNLYKMAVEALLQPPVHPTDTPTKLTEETLLSYAPPGSLQPSDVIVQNMQLTYSMYGKNPVDNVRFFTSMDSSESYSVPRAAVSLLLPDTFQECTIRVYCRNPDKVEAARKAFDVWLQHCRVEVALSPPHPTATAATTTATTPAQPPQPMAAAAAAAPVTPPRKPKSASRLLSPFPASPPSDY